MAATSNITQCLQNTLSSDPNARISAELQLSDLLAQPGSLTRLHYIVEHRNLTTRLTDAGLALLHIILAQDADMSLRQMSTHVYLGLDAT